MNQVSTHLNRYIGFAPDNLVYDKSARTYVCNSEFNQQFFEPDANCYLAQLRLMTDGILCREDSWFDNSPSFASPPIPVRGPKPAMLRSVVCAIRRSEAIEVNSQSLSSTKPRWRWIVSHAIAFEGCRWRRRASCLSDDCFKDFLLSHILETGGSRESEVPPEEDRNWHSEVTARARYRPVCQKIAESTARPSKQRGRP